MTDVFESSKTARDKMLRLVSESMEVRMQTVETLLQLQSTMKAIQQLRAGPWPGRQADMQIDSFPDPMIRAESLHSF